MPAVLRRRGDEGKGMVDHMDDLGRRIFVRNEWYEHEGNRSDIRVFHDADHFYLEVLFEDGRTARDTIEIDKEDCLDFKRFNNPNLVEDLVNRVKWEIKGGETLHRR